MDRFTSGGYSTEFLGADAVMLVAVLAILGYTLYSRV